MAEQQMPRDALLVEDNSIIAIHVEEMLLGFGIATVRSASRVKDALAAIEERMPDFAVLDVDLGNENCFAVAERLADAGVPFVFSTGYGEHTSYPARFAGVQKLLKPYSQEALHAALVAAASK